MRHAHVFMHQYDSIYPRSKSHGQRDPVMGRHDGIAAVQRTSGAVADAHPIGQIRRCGKYKHPVWRGVDIYLRVHQRRRGRCIVMRSCGGGNYGIKVPYRAWLYRIGRFISQQFPRIEFGIKETIAAASGPYGVQVSTDTLNTATSAVLDSAVTGVVPALAVIPVKTDNAFPNT